MSPLQSAKLWLVQHVDLAKDALHIYVALGLFFGAALAFGWKVRNWKPLAVVLAAALVGEAWDLRDSAYYATPVNLWGNFKDVLNTLFWPSAIVLLARCTRVFERD